MLSPEEISIRYNTLLNKVVKLRNTQMKHEKFHVGEDYKKKKRLERELDAFLREEIKRINSNQLEIV